MTEVESSGTPNINTGDVITADWLMRLRKYAEGVSRSAGDNTYLDMPSMVNGQDELAPTAEHWIGKITDCSGSQEKLSDARYYVQEQYVKKGHAAGKSSHEAADRMEVEADARDNALSITAVNLAELSTVDKSLDTHRLPKDTLVHVFSWHITADDPYGSAKGYFFDRQPSDGCVLKVTGSATGTGIYNVSEVVAPTGDLSASTDIGSGFIGQSVAGGFGINLLEFGNASGVHDIDSGQAQVYFPGRLYKLNSDGTRWYTFLGFQTGCA